jgi:asparagine synthase (glutamine-hydrolysing)
MCGITGYWVRRGDPTPWLADLGASVDSLAQRGPDDQGVWVRPGARVGLGHTRLSILDLSPLGHQPMRSPDGTLTMVFNGEIYNFAAVRSELEALGHRFRSSGDSEVVLAAWQQWGIAAAERFVGMFAIAIWNERERRLVLLRDRMGVKPLYYAFDGRTFWFGSELKALRAFSRWAPEVDRDALGEYLQFGYISAPRSIYRGVSKLMPGHWLELGEVGEPVARRWWAPPAGEAPLDMPEEELERRLETILVDAFRHRMVADVPVGVFLSGGIDSSIVAALLQRYGAGDVRTFTIGFEDARFDESRHAKRVAQYLGTRHCERIVTAGDMKDVLGHWADLFDEPFGDTSGIPTYLVSKMAREHVKVALSADGGDELFCGYAHYGVVLERQRALARWPGAARRALAMPLSILERTRLQAAADRLPLPVGTRHAARRAILERLAKLSVMLPRADAPTVYDLAMSFWTPWDIAALLGGEVAPRERVEGPGGVAEQMVHCDLRHYLPDDILAKVDRTTMAAGLEGREPMLDHRLVEFALRLPLSMRRGALGTKHLLRKVLYKHVPRELIERPKQGFAIPLASWLRGELAPLIDEYLAPRRIRDGGLLDPQAVARAVANFREGGPGNDRLDVQKVWLLLAFEMWRDRWDTGYQRRTDEGAIHARAVHHQ